MKTNITALLVLSIVTTAYAEDKKWSRVDHENLIPPVTASFLGGTGTEWLVGGGFQPDGTLVFAGVTIGPEFNLNGAAVNVIGTDGTVPAAEPWPIQRDGKGQPRKTREGKIKLDKFNYQHPAATPFVVRLKADKIESVIRLPWQSGTVTSCVVGQDGGIYLAGFGKVESLATTCDHVESFDPPDVEFGKSKPPLRTAYLARVNPDGQRLDWLRTCEAHLDFPRLELLSDGNILFKGLAFDTFNAEGKLVARLAFPKGLNPSHYDVNEQSGEFAYGHEHHWPTGREPWRCPELKIYHKDGTTRYHLYDWPGPIVGSDASRLVSDSAVRNIQYMADGTLLYTAWSDGGNSVMYNQPYDLYEKGWDSKNAGLRLSAAGAGAMSFAYVIKLDPQTCKIKFGTLWTSQYKGVESARINAVLPTSDGSVAIAGAVYGHLYSTPNQFEAGEQRGGPNLTILNSSLDGLRFSSYMPGCGEIDTGNRAQFQWFRGNVNGRELLVAVSGCKNHEYAPRLKAIQTRHGGGHLDGHFVVFDLGKK